MTKLGHSEHKHRKIPAVTYRATLSYSTSESLA